MFIVTVPGILFPKGSEQETDAQLKDILGLNEQFIQVIVFYPVYVFTHSISQLEFDVVLFQKPVQSHAGSVRI